MRPAIDVIMAAFGGLRPFARAIGKTASTVQYWKDEGFLPRDQREPVLAALIDRGTPKRRAERLVEKAIAGTRAGELAPATA
jgi:hypothetical protein